MPLTPNGALDQRGLPATESQAYAGRPYEAPRGEVEEILAGIWQGLLSVERAGRQDNFFELGGHSFLVVQMLARLRQVGLIAEVRQVFESPTLENLASALSRAAADESVPPNLIAADCEAIGPPMLPLVELEAEHIKRIVSAVPGGVGNIQDIYPLTPLQEGMLFRHLLNVRDADTYGQPLVLRARSRSRLDELIAALQSVIDRHDVLRTAVLWEQLPRPLQVVYRRAALPVEQIALDRHREVGEQIKEWLEPGRQQLDLRRAPLLGVLVAADPHSEGWYVWLQSHQIAIDHAALEIVTAEIMAHLEGRALPLPESMPYRNHVAQVLARARAHDAETFFRSKLANIDEPRAPFGLLDARGDAGQLVEARQIVDVELAQRMRLQARRLHVSTATLFHVAWALVVARTSGRDDVVFGTVLSGRLHGEAGAHRTLGTFINMLPLRLQLQEMTAKELVEQTQRELAALLNHEQASLAVAQRCSGIADSAPLFTAVLNYRHSSPDIATASTAASGIEFLRGQERTNYPVTLAVDDLGDGISLMAQTDPRIDPQRITSYVHTAVQSLVKALKEAPGTPVQMLSILPDSERQRILELFNTTRAAFPREQLIHELFEEQVSRTPTAVAVVFEGESLSYAELNAKANQLARHLRARGIGPDRLVALCMERSVEMVVGLLGTLKAGGAYVPLDPGYPIERLSYMLSDCSPSVVLSQSSLRPILPPAQAEVIMLDDAWQQIAVHGTDNLDTRALQLGPQHLAYVIYTSGSTGQPKGAMNEHCAVMNRLQWMQQQYQLTERDRVVQKTPFSFDVSVWEFFWTLLSGARLILARPQGHRDPDYLRSLIEEMGVTTVHFVPSMLQIFLDELQPGRCGSLRRVVCSGEELPASLQRKFFQCLPQAQLFNLYGPTEAAVDVTWWECDRLDQASRVPIGRPISNIRIYILDDHRQPVPIGVAGEICIGGVGVGRGYLNRPELTAKRFVADPFNDDPQGRIYRTGDLGRWREDGVIEYLGRLDNQIKIRGFRIELDEIRSILMECPGVVAAAVTAKRRDPENLASVRIDAYVVLRAGTLDKVREHSARWLPSHMMPNTLTVLTEIPLNINGKLDIAKLPEPTPSTHTEACGDIAKPATAASASLEAALQKIWDTVMGCNASLDHDFFELGGNSLYAVLITAAIRREELGNLPVRELYLRRTIRAVAAYLRGTF